MSLVAPHMSWYQSPATEGMEERHMVACTLLNSTADEHHPHTPPMGCTGRAINFLRWWQAVKNMHCSGNKRDDCKID